MELRPEPLSRLSSPLSSPLESELELELSLDSVDLEEEAVEVPSLEPDSEVEAWGVLEAAALEATLSAVAEAPEFEFPLLLLLLLLLSLEAAAAVL